MFSGVINFIKEMQNIIAVNVYNFELAFLILVFPLF